MSPTIGISGKRFRKTLARVRIDLAEQPRFRSASLEAQFQAADPSEQPSNDQLYVGGRLF